MMYCLLNVFAYINVALVMIMSLKLYVFYIYLTNSNAWLKSLEYTSEFFICMNSFICKFLGLFSGDMDV